MTDTPAASPRDVEFIEKLAALCAEYELETHTCGCCRGLSFDRVPTDPYAEHEVVWSDVTIVKERWRGDDADYVTRRNYEPDHEKGWY